MPFAAQISPTVFENASRARYAVGSVFERCTRVSVIVSAYWLRVDVGSRGPLLAIMQIGNLSALKVIELHPHTNDSCAI